MAISSGNIIQVILDYAYPGAGTALNIFYWIFAGQDRDESAFLDDLESWADIDWATLWDNLASTQATINEMEVNEVTTTGLLVRPIGTRLINHAGSQAGDVLPAADSGYLQAYTAVPRVYGKKYVPGISEDAIESGEFPAQGVIDLLALLTQYFTPEILAGGGTLFPGVISTKTGGFVQFLEAGITDTRPAYQRRRKDGVGS